MFYIFDLKGEKILCGFMTSQIRPMGIQNLVLPLHSFIQCLLGDGVERKKLGMIFVGGDNLKSESLVKT